MKEITRTVEIYEYNFVRKVGDEFEEQTHKSLKRLNKKGLEKLAETLGDGYVYFNTKINEKKYAMSLEYFVENAQEIG